MKGIFSVAAFLALASAIVSSAPLAPRTDDLIFVPGTNYFVIEQALPNTVITPNATSTAMISITNGNKEIDSFVTFQIPPATNVTFTPTCQFMVKNVTATGSKRLQLFTVGAPITKPPTFNMHPFYNQYEGQYVIDATGNSAPVDVFRIPCAFGETLQFVMRPQNTNDMITWTQGGDVGAFLQVNFESSI